MTLACQRDMTPRTLGEWERLWLDCLLSEAGLNVSATERLAIEMQSWSWAWQQIHGRGMPPASEMWKALALKLAPGADLSRVFIPLPPNPWELLT